MELSCFTIKKKYISGNGTFLYFRKELFQARKIKSTYFFSPSSKTKKNHPEKYFLYSGKMELSSSNIENIFSRESCSYISGDGNPEKNYYVFSKESFFYISGNGNPEKTLYILGNGTFLPQF